MGNNIRPTAPNVLSRSEAVSIKETGRAIDELNKLEIENFSLVINGIIPREGRQNPLFAAHAKIQGTI